MQPLQKWVRGENAQKQMVQDLLLWAAAELLSLVPDKLFTKPRVKVGKQCPYCSSDHLYSHLWDLSGFSPAISVGFPFWCVCVCVNTFWLWQNLISISFVSERFMWSIPSITVLSDFCLYEILSPREWPHVKSCHWWHKLFLCIVDGLCCMQQWDWFSPPPLSLLSPQRALLAVSHFLLSLILKSFLLMKLLKFSFFFFFSLLTLTSFFLMVSEHCFVWITPKFHSCLFVCWMKLKAWTQLKWMVRKDVFEFLC